MKFNGFLLAIVLILGILSVEASPVLYAAPPARDCSGSNVWISYPTADAVVSGSFAITGSAALPPGEFQYYKLEYSRAGANNWVVIVDRVRAAISGGTLANVNADALPRGDYTIRLLAVDRTGNYCEAFASPVHVGETSQTPTPGTTPTETPLATPSTQPTPSAQSTLAPQKVATLAPSNLKPTPTLVIDIPTAVPGSDSLLGKSQAAKNSIPALPFDLGSAGSVVGSWFGQLGRFFVFGMQFTAGIFALLGVVVFLRRNL